MSPGALFDDDAAAIDRFEVDKTNERCYQHGSRTTGGVAQVVEQGSHNPRVGSSSLPAAIPREPGRPRGRRADQRILHQVRLSVDREIRARGLLTSEDRVLVAVSGGPDSVALLALLAERRRREPTAAPMAVAHLDHGTRGASGARDLLFTAALGRSLGLEPFVGRREVVGGGSEAVWRRDRFVFLQAIRAAWGANVVALGHHRDDQAETVLQRLARGAGLDALGGMRWRRADGVVRPLLGLSRREILAYIEARALPRVEDRSNRDLGHLRNRLRHEVLPSLQSALGVDMSTRLARLAESLQRAASPSQPGTAGEAPPGEGRGELAIASVRAAGDRAGDLVYGWLRDLDRSPNERQVSAVVRLARGERPSGWVELGSGVRVERVYDRIVLARCTDSLATRSATEGAPALAIELPLGHTTCWGERWRVGTVAEPVRQRDRAGAVAGPLGVPRAAAAWPGEGSYCAQVPARVLAGGIQVRARAPGERMQRSSGRRKVSDLMIDARLPMRERSGWPIFAIGDVPIWIPGVALAWFPRQDGKALEESPNVLLRAKRLDLPLPGCCDTRQPLGVTCRDQD